MGDSVTMHPAQVRAWGVAARAQGTDIGVAKASVSAAEEDAGYARMAGLATKAATDTYMTRVERGVGQVATDVTGTGDKLAHTVAVVEDTDYENVNLFRHTGGPAP